jgi:hypothetical protein
MKNVLKDKERESYFANTLFWTEGKWLKRSERRSIASQHEHIPSLT